MTIEPIYEGTAGTAQRPKTQKIYRFPNGLGASALIQTTESGEEWAELLPIKFDGSGVYDWDSIKVSFSLPGFGGLVGTDMTPDEVQAKLREIRDLDAAEITALEGK
jgi:hypothetical protein